jgi:DNA-binding transcriptional regulator GbsR (MarR family)
VDWKIYAWVKRGSRRKEILDVIINSKNPVTAKDLSNLQNISLSQVSLVLKELQEKNLIKCLNETDTIGRIYSASELAITIMMRMKP